MKACFFSMVSHDTYIYGTWHTFSFCLRNVFPPTNQTFSSSFWNGISPSVTLTVMYDGGPCSLLFYNICHDTHSTYQTWPLLVSLLLVYILILPMCFKYVILNRIHGSNINVLLKHNIYTN